MHRRLDIHKCKAPCPSASTLLRSKILILTLSSVIAVSGSAPAPPIVMPPCCQRTYGGHFLDDVAMRPASESLEEFSRWVITNRLIDADSTQLITVVAAIEGVCEVSCSPRLAAAKISVRALSEKRSKQEDRRQTWLLFFGGAVVSLLTALVTALVTYLLMRARPRRTPLTPPLQARRPRR